MADETQAKILRLLDVLAVEVAAGRNDTARLVSDVSGLRGEVGNVRHDLGALRREVRSGFERTERRFDALENCVGGIDTEMRSFRREFERRVALLER